jgi:hypothetical protein
VPDELGPKVALAGKRRLGRCAAGGGDGFESGVDPRALERRRTWFLTVSVLRGSSAAICFVEQPCSRSRSTSTCRGLRCGGGAAALSSGRSSISPKTPTTRSPSLSATALTSTGTRVPALETRWPVASLATEVPSIF